MKTSDIFTHIYSQIQNTNLPFFTNLTDCFDIEYEVFFEIHQKGLILTIFKEDTQILSDNIVYTINNLQKIPLDLSNFLTESDIKINYIIDDKSEIKQVTVPDYIEVLQKPIVNNNNINRLDNIDKLNSLSNSYLDLVSVKETDINKHRKILDDCEMISQQLDIIQSELFTQGLLERSCQNDYYFNNYISPIVADTKNVYIENMKLDEEDNIHNRLVYYNLGLSNKKTEPNGIYQLKHLLFCYSSSYAHRKQSEFKCETIKCPGFFSDISKENWYGSHLKTSTDLDFNPSYYKYNLDKNGLMISCNKYNALLTNGGNIMTNLNNTSPINIPSISNAYENQIYYKTPISIYETEYEIINHNSNSYWDMINNNFSYYICNNGINNSTSVLSYSNQKLPLQSISNIIIDKEGKNNYLIQDYTVKNQFDINNQNFRFAFGPKYLLIDNVIDEKIKGKICDGSNNKVDILYKNKILKDASQKKDLWIPPNKEFTNKINKPPSKIKYLDGEKLNIIGYLWHSTHNNSYNWYKSYHTKIVSSLGECTIIEPICNNSLNIYDILQSNKIKENEYNTFTNESTFHINKNTLFLFNLFNTNKLQLTLQQKNYFINKIIPSINDVLDIYQTEFGLSGNIYDINKILLKVGLRLEDGDPFQKQQLIKTLYQRFEKYGELIINISRLEKQNSYQLLLENNQLHKFNIDLLYFFKHIKIPDTQILFHIIRFIATDIRLFLQKFTLNFIITYLQYLNLTDSQNIIKKNSNIFLIKTISLLSKLLTEKTGNIYHIFANIQIDLDKIEIINLTNESDTRELISIFLSAYFYYSYLTPNYDSIINTYFIFNNQDILFQNILSNYTQNISSLITSGIKKYNMPIYQKYIIKLNLILNNSEDKGDLIKSYFLQKYIKEINQYTHNCFNLDDLNDEMTRLTNLYKIQKKASNITNPDCRDNIIKKKYYNKQNLIRDNYHVIYSENIFDNITDDLIIFINVLVKTSTETTSELHNLLTEELQEKYFLLNTTFINERVNYIISIYNNYVSIKKLIWIYGNDINKCRIGNEKDKLLEHQLFQLFWTIVKKYPTFSVKLAKNINKYNFGIPIKDGDYALLYTNHNQFLYKRIHDIWIKQSNNEIITNNSLCYSLNNKCNYINNYCVKQDNQTVNKLHSLKSKINKLKEKINILTNLNHEYSDIDDLMQTKIKSLQQNIRFDRLVNLDKKSYRDYLLNNRKPLIKVLTNSIPEVYSDALYRIFKMSDPFNKFNRLNLFINRYGLVSSQDKNIYWKLPEITIHSEILCCQHYLDLIDINSYYGDVKIKKTDIFLTKWNSSLDEKYYVCSNCNAILSEKQLKDAPVFNDDNKVDTNIEASQSISDQLAETLTNKEQVLYQTKLLHYINNLDITPDINVADIKILINKIINLDSETNIHFSDYLTGLNNLSTKNLIFNIRQDKNLIKQVRQTYFHKLRLDMNLYLSFDSHKISINDKLLSKFKTNLNDFLQINKLSLTQLPGKINVNNYRDYLSNLPKNNIYRNYNNLTDNLLAYRDNISDLQKYEKLINTCLQINLLVNNYRLNNYYLESLNSLTIICCYLFTLNNNNTQVNFLHSKDSKIVNIWSNYYKDSSNLISKIDNQLEISLDDFSDSQIQFVKNLAMNFSDYSDIKRSILSDKVDDMLLNILYPTRHQKKLSNDKIISVNIFHKILTEINTSYYKQLVKGKCQKDIEAHLLISQTESLYWRHFLPNLLPLQYDFINDTHTELSLSKKIVFFLNYQVNNANNIMKVKSNKENVYSGLLTKIKDINLYKNNTELANLIMQSNILYYNNNKLIYNIDNTFTHNPIKKLNNLSYYYLSNIDYKTKIIELYTKYCFSTKKLAKKRIYHKIYFPSFNDYNTFYLKYINNKIETINQIKTEINAFILNKSEINIIDIFNDLTITHDLDLLVKNVLRNNGYLLYDIVEHQFKISIKNSIHDYLTDNNRVNKILLDNIDILLNQKNTINNNQKSISLYYHNHQYLNIYHDILLILKTTIRKYIDKYPENNILKENIILFSNISDKLQTLLESNPTLEIINNQINPLLQNTLDSQQSIFKTYSNVLLRTASQINPEIISLFQVLIDRQTSIKNKTILDYQSQLINTETLDKLLINKFISQDIKSLLDILKLLDINLNTNNFLLSLVELYNIDIELTDLKTYYEIIYFVVLLNINLFIFDESIPSEKEITDIQIKTK